MGLQGQNAKGSLERYKARLVAKGYNQREWVNYFDTFSPIAKIVTVIVDLPLASMNKWPFYHMDVNNAFLQSDLYEEVYMKLPKGFCKQGKKGNLVC